MPAAGDRIRGFGELFSASWKLITENLGLAAGVLFAHFGILLIPMVVWMLGYFALFATFFGSVLSDASLDASGNVLYDGIPNTAALIGGGAVAVVIFIIAYIAIILLGVWMEGSMWTMIQQLDRGGSDGVGDIMKKSWKKKWVLLGVAILSGLAVGGASILLIIPGLILAVYFGFSNAVAVLEDRSVVDSMKRSWHLVRGYFWPTVGRMVLLGLVAFAVFIPAMLVAIIPVLGALAIVALELFVMAFAYAFMYNIYKDLVRLNGKHSA